MDPLASVQNILLLVIALVALGVQGYALIDAFRQRTDAFPAAGKWTKPIWLGILGVALAIGVIFIQAPFAFPNLIAFVAAAVYLVDVRPALRSVSGGGNSGGPYGGW